MAQFTKINVPTRKDMFVLELEHMIFSGQLKVGEKLPTERELADAMQVSRGVIHTGLSELERKGLLSIEPRVGTTVADYRTTGNFETLNAMINYSGAVLHKDEIASILELRCALSNTIVRKLIASATEDDLNVLQELCDEIGSAPDIQSACDAAFRFHHKMAVLSGNFLMPLLYNSFHDTVLPLWKRFCEMYGIAQLHQNTQKLMNYIMARDAEGATSYTDTLIDASITGAFQLIDKDHGSDIAMEMF